jgi:hypothetical protein
MALAPVLRWALARFAAICLALAMGHVLFGLNGRLIEL